MSFERQRIDRKAVRTLALPFLPKIPGPVRAQFPNLRQAFERWDAENEEWRQKAQNVLEQAILALLLDTDDGSRRLAQGITEPQVRSIVSEILKNQPQTKFPDIARALDRYVQEAGDTMTGFLTLSGDPVDPLHAATRQWVLAQIQSALQDFTYRHEQVTAAATWTIDHGLGRRAVGGVFVSDREVTPDWHNTSDNQTVINHGMALSGYAELR